ncbi:MAG TPA: sugar kinase [Sphingomonas sp.]|jgi:2-dehydro-3-deoxygluconokinase|uniref:sugar kinase n=1 Tax=Sphingomonas sp. TaxID=28214 RepID=UPI002ED8F00F
MARIVVIGEGMIELASPGGGWRLGYGGDTLNTAIHLARFGHDVAFATALGSDPFSRDLTIAWEKERIDTSLILTDPHRIAGLYAIRTDAAGERSFTYWRSDSAARQLCGLPDWRRIVAAAEAADILCLSLISLAILPPAGRETLMALCRQVRGAGGRVVLDGNYRPRLWENVDIAQAVRTAAIGCCDIGLPTLEDEAALCGTPDAATVADQWRALGAGEVVVKTGSEGCRIDGTTIAPPQRLSPIDTSGAGDAFNAGYLHGRLIGHDRPASAMIGHRLAGWVVMQPGAVPAQAADAPYAV